MSSLSVCIIAKNEEANLRRALTSVRDVVDEIVVTDTGSSDGTIGVAQEFAARVSSFEWCDDFSAAYNYCLDQARTDWILLLDADEELLSESRPEVQTCIERADVLAYTVLRQDLAQLDRLDYFTEMLQTRLFRVRSDLRFIGRIHHQFITPLQRIASREGLHVRPSSIRLRHYGYAGNLREAKLNRAAQLMELELRDRPGQFYFLVELGRSWLALGDLRGVELLTQAAQILRDDPQRALESGGTLAMLLEHILACDVLPPNFPVSYESVREFALRSLPNAVPLLWQMALHEYKRQRFAKCAEFLERIIELGRTNTYDRMASFQPSILGGDALLNLGVCYSQTGRISDARKCFEQLLNQPEYEQRAQQNLAVLRDLQLHKAPPTRL
jgi:tetratricopeptide (TPR) repeat protein